MKKEYLEKLEQIISPELNQIILAISNAGGQLILVGGAVRDLFFNIQVKDIDIEVHKLSLEKLEKILFKFGIVSLVGKFFGILKLHGLDVDWSIPRIDSSGRKPVVKLDPNMELKQAFARRDLTINAMGIDLITKELIDPFNGFRDLQDGILRATDKKFFKEDPLRFFRVMQFVGRFNFKPDEELNKLCREIDLTKISKERIEEEFEKLFLKSKKPSLGIDWLNQVGRLKEILPELYDTIGVPQRADYHPEGDVFEHSKQAMDLAASLDYANKDEKLLIVISAMCHDLGKVVSTTINSVSFVVSVCEAKVLNHESYINSECCTIKSIGHEYTGAPLAKKLVQRITRKTDLIKKVPVLVKYHMCPSNYLRNYASDGAYKKLAWNIHKESDLTMYHLYQLLCADRLGRNGLRGHPLPMPDNICEQFLNKAKDLGILQSPEASVINGRDLEALGVKPGPAMGKLLDKVYSLQIKMGIQDKSKLLKKILG